MAYPRGFGFGCGSAALRYFLLACSRSAREVMLTLNINFASRARFLHYIFKPPAGRTFAFTGCAAHI